VQKSTENFFAEILKSASLSSRLSKELKNIEIQLLKVGLNLDLVW